MFASGANSVPIRPEIRRLHFAAVQSDSPAPVPAGIPRLEVLPIADVLRHEATDLMRVAALLERLSDDRALRNPPIVAALSGGRRLLLDGANRVEALARLGVPHALVQTEERDDPRLGIETWRHVIRRPEADALLADPPPGISAHDGDAPEGATIACALTLADGRRFGFACGPSLAERAAALRAIADRHTHPRARLGRLPTGDLDEARLAHPDLGGVLSYPGFGLDEVRALAEAGERLPSGVTRLLAPCRVLGFHLPLSFLTADLPLDQKRRRLADMVAERFQTGRVRHYPEPVFVFDD